MFDTDAQTCACRLVDTHYGMLYYFIWQELLNYFELDSDKMNSGVENFSRHN